MPVDQRLVSKLSVYLIHGLFLMKSSFTCSQISLIIFVVLVEKKKTNRVVGETLASGLMFTRSLCSDKAGERQRVGELAEIRVWLSKGVRVSTAGLWLEHGARRRRYFRKLKC